MRRRLRRQRTNEPMERGTHSEPCTTFHSWCPIVRTVVFGVYDVPAFMETATDAAPRRRQRSRFHGSDAGDSLGERTGVRPALRLKADIGLGG